MLLRDVLILCGCYALFVHNFASRPRFKDVHTITNRRDLPEIVDRESGCYNHL